MTIFSEEEVGLHVAKSWTQRLQSIRRKHSITFNVYFWALLNCIRIPLLLKKLSGKGINQWGGTIHMQTLHESNAAQVDLSFPSVLLFDCKMEWQEDREHHSALPFWVTSTKGYDSLGLGLNWKKWLFYILEQPLSYLRKRCTRFIIILTSEHTVNALPYYYHVLVCVFQYTPQLVQETINCCY